MEDELGLLLASVSEAFPNDRTKPGVQLSMITPSLFYGAVHRYLGGPDDRVMLVSCRSESLRNTVYRLLEEWCRGPYVRDGSRILAYASDLRTNQARADRVVSVGNPRRAGRDPYFQAFDEASPYSEYLVRTVERVMGSFAPAPRKTILRSLFAFHMPGLYVPKDRFQLVEIE